MIDFLSNTNGNDDYSVERMLSKANKYLYRDFWSNYYDTFIMKYGHMRRIFDDERLLVGGIFNGNLFADFRGVIISEKAVRFSDNDFFEDRKSPSWGEEAKRKLLPFLNAGCEKVREYEYAINYMADGHALYMSSLAPQLSNADTSSYTPLEFIVYAHQQREAFGKKYVVVNKWQLGRIITQLHRLGAIRLLALVDLDKLREAGRGLRELDEQTQHGNDGLDVSAGLLSRVREKFISLTTNFVHDTAYGLIYRVERSRYYVSQFFSGVKLLRIHPLEGDQTYQQFVERRMGSEFDFIDRLWRRYERAVNRLILSNQNYLAEHIASMQEWAELALIAVLIPYYLLGVLGNFVNPSHLAYLGMGIWLCFVCGGVFHFKKDEFPFWSRVTTASMAGGVVMLLYGLLWLSQALHFPAPDEVNNPEIQLQKLADQLKLQEEQLKSQAVHLGMHQDSMLMMQQFIKMQDEQIALLRKQKEAPPAASPSENQKPKNRNHRVEHPSGP
jgi:hypothetical protein